MPSRMKRSDRTSITSIALSLRATRRQAFMSELVEHVEHPILASIVGHDCGAPAAAECTIRRPARACRAWAAYGGPSAPRVARCARLLVIDYPARLAQQSGDL